MKINGKIDNYFIKNLNLDLNKDYKITNIESKKLLVSERIDLIAKIKYIEYLEKKINSSYFKELYLSTIEAFSEGRYNEPGNKNKNNAKKFINSFNELIDGIKTSGIDKERSIIPVGKNNAIIDGAHRTAISIYYNYTVPVIKIVDREVNYNYDFFKKRLLSEEMLNYMYTEYAKMKDNIYCICLWPKCSKEQSEIATKMIESNLKVIMKKTIKLTYNGLRNFMIQIYGNQKWVGTVKNKHAPVTAKANNCYSKQGELTLFIIEEQDVKNIVNLKTKIREKLNLENHSIHSTDTKEETNEMLNLIMNKNSVEFLNNANIDEYPKLYDKLKEFALLLNKNKISKNDIVIDGSSVLAAYGLRENNDIDAIIKENLEKCYSNIFEFHNNLCNYYGKNADDLIYNPNNYFYFNGFKFVKISLIKDMKKKRNEKKDKLDVKLISSISNTEINPGVILIKFRFTLKKLIRNIVQPLKIILIKILKKLKLFDVVKKIKDNLVVR